MFASVCICIVCQCLCYIHTVLQLHMSYMNYNVLHSHNEEPCSLVVRAVDWQSRDFGFRSQSGQCVCLWVKKQLSSMRLHQKVVVADFCWLFHQYFHSVSPPAHSSSPLIDRHPVQGVGTYTPMKPTKPSLWALHVSGKEHVICLTDIGLLVTSLYPITLQFGK